MENDDLHPPQPQVEQHVSQQSPLSSRHFGRPILKYGLRKLKHNLQLEALTTNVQCSTM